MAHLGGERILRAAAILADDHPASEHVLHAVGVGARVGAAGGVCHVAVGRCKGDIVSYNGSRLSLRSAERAVGRCKGDIVS